MSNGRIVLIPPAAPGSGGDEGMILGALKVFRGRDIVVLNPTPDDRWLNALRISRSGAGTVSEVPGPMGEFAQHFVSMTSSS